MTSHQINEVLYQSQVGDQISFECQQVLMPQFYADFKEDNALFGVLLKTDRDEVEEAYARLAVAFLLDNDPLGLLQVIQSVAQEAGAEESQAKCAELCKAVGIHLRLGRVDPRPTAFRVQG